MVNVGDSSYSDSGKSVEELAREAMKAIKDSEKRNSDKEEYEAQKEMRDREEALKNEVKQKLKRKLRRLEKEEEKKPKEDVKDPRLMVDWINPDKSGIVYEGRYNDSYTFKIQRGFNLYHLYVEDKKLEVDAWQRSTCTSIDLFTLKEKADKILKEAIRRSDEIKKNENPDPS